MDKKDDEKKEAKIVIKTKLNKNGIGLAPQNNPDIQWCILKYVELCRGDMLSKESIIAYTKSANKFAEYIGGAAKAKDLTLKIMEGYKNYLIRKGVAQNWVVYHLQVINRMIRRLVDIGELPYSLRSIPERLKMPKKVDDRRITILNPEDIRKLMSMLDLKSQVQAWLMLMTGMRKQDLLNLKWSNIDLYGKRIICTVKGRKRIVLPITDDTVAVLNQWRDGMKPRERKSEYVFCDLSAQEPQKGLYRIALALKKINKEFVIHTLRHTYATWFLQATGDLMTLKEIMGHSDINTTSRYLHIVDEHKREMQAIYNEGLKQAYLQETLPRHQIMNHMNTGYKEIE